MEENLGRAGKWLLWKVQQCHTRKVKAEEELAACGKDIEYLQQQWTLQVETQTQLLPSMLVTNLLQVQANHTQNNLRLRARLQSKKPNTYGYHRMQSVLI